MVQKISIGLICGGTSGEHGVSLISAYNIQAALSRKKYDVLIIGIDRNGSWFLDNSPDFFKNIDDVGQVSFHKNYPIALPQKNFTNTKEFENKLKNVDVFFPITHGKLGEDGALQGLLELTGKPYVGSDIYGSAICMDKEVSKRLLKYHGIPVARHRLIRNPHELSFEKLKRELGSPFIVKPCREGSSLGVSKVFSAEDYEQSLSKAFELDRKVLVEELILGREIECSVLGNDSPEAASVLGEIVPHREFYSFEAKYVDQNGADLIIPAKIDKVTSRKIRKAAVDAFLVTECRGMARVDFFLRKDSTFIINEINTLPGFTKISMFPKLWEASGLPYTKLLDKLIELAYKY